MTMYNNKLAVCIKTAGKVLREHKDLVYLPFGSEYSILIKNLNSVRALVSVELDGDNVADGTKLIVQPNSEFNLERFIRNGNFEQGNRFRFIERTESIEEHRGVQADDGLVRVEFQFEQPQPIITWNECYKPMFPVIVDNTHWSTPSVVYYGDPTPLTSQHAPGFVRGGGTTTSITTHTGADSVSATYTCTNDTFAVNDAGITVPGSLSQQQFVAGNWFPVETIKHVIILKLVGKTKQGRQVQRAVTVKSKPKCVTCGRVNKATSKFCVECGTSLQIV